MGRRKPEIERGDTRNAREKDRYKKNRRSKAANKDEFAVWSNEVYLFNILKVLPDILKILEV